MGIQHTKTDTTALAIEVESLVDSPEPDGIYHDTRECAGALLALGLLLIAPPTPRPKKPSRS